MMTTSDTHGTKSFTVKHSLSNLWDEKYFHLGDFRILD